MFQTKEEYDQAFAMQATPEAQQQFIEQYGDGSNLPTAAELEVTEVDQTGMAPATPDQVIQEPIQLPTEEERLAQMTPEEVEQDKLETKEAIDNYNQYMKEEEDAVFEADLLRKQEEQRLKNAAKDDDGNILIDAMTGQPIEGEPSFGESVYNSINNAVLQVREFAPNLNITTAEVYRKVLGDEFVDEQIKQSQGDLAEGENNILQDWWDNGWVSMSEEEQKKSRQERELLQAEMGQTREIIESAKEGDIAGIIAGGVNALTSLGSSMAISAATAGAGLFTDFFARNYIDYNEALAEEKGKSLEELREDKEDSFWVPAAFSTLMGISEKVGLDKIQGVQKALKTMKPGVKKKIASILTAGTTEGSTEMIQTALEKSQETMAKTDNDAAAATGRFFEAFTEQDTWEAGIQGFLGGAGFSGGPNIDKKDIQTASAMLRGKVEAKNIDNRVAKLMDLKQKASQTKDPQVKDLLMKQARVIENDLKKQIRDENKVVQKLNDDQIDKLSKFNSSLKSIKDQRAELDAKVQSGEIDVDQYMAAVESLQTQVNDVETKVSKIKEEAQEQPIVRDPDGVPRAKAQKIYTGNLSQQAQKIYEEKGIEGAAEIIETNRGLIENIAKAKWNAALGSKEQAFTRNDFKKALEFDMMKLINSYNPESKVPLNAYIRQQLPKRVARIFETNLKDFTQSLGGIDDEGGGDRGVVDEGTVDLQDELGDITINFGKTKANAINLGFSPQTTQAIENTTKRVLGSRLPDPSNKVAFDKAIKNELQEETSQIVHEAMGTRKAFNDFVTNNADQIVKALPKKFLEQGRQDWPELSTPVLQEELNNWLFGNPKKKKERKRALANYIGEFMAGNMAHDLLQTNSEVGQRFEAVQGLNNDIEKEGGFDRAISVVDRAIDALSKYTTGENLHMGGIEAPVNVAIGGLRATKLALQGGKALTEALNDGYRKVKDYMNEAEWARWVRDQFNQNTINRGALQEGLESTDLEMAQEGAKVWEKLAGEKVDQLNVQIRQNETPDDEYKAINDDKFAKNKAFFEKHLDAYLEHLPKGFWRMTIDSYTDGSWNWKNSTLDEETAKEWEKRASKDDGLNWNGKDYTSTFKFGKVGDLNKRKQFYLDKAAKLTPIIRQQQEVMFSFGEALQNLRKAGVPKGDLATLTRTYLNSGGGNSNIFRRAAVPMGYSGKMDSGTVGEHNPPAGFIAMSTYEYAMNGQIDEEFKQAVRDKFGVWVIDKSYDPMAGDRYKKSFQQLPTKGFDIVKDDPNIRYWASGGDVTDIYNNQGVPLAVESGMPANLVKKAKDSGELAEYIKQSLIQKDGTSDWKDSVLEAIEQIANDSDNPTLENSLANILYEKDSKNLPEWSKVVKDINKAAKQHQKSKLRAERAVNKAARRLNGGKPAKPSTKILINRNTVEHRGKLISRDQDKLAAGWKAMFEMMDVAINNPNLKARELPNHIDLSKYPTVKNPNPYAASAKNYAKQYALGAMSSSLKPENRPSNFQQFMDEAKAKWLDTRADTIDEIVTDRLSNKEIWLGEDDNYYTDNGHNQITPEEFNELKMDEFFDMMDEFDRDVYKAAKDKLDQTIERGYRDIPLNQLVDDDFEQMVAEQESEVYDEFQSEMEFPGADAAEQVYFKMLNEYYENVPKVEQVVEINDEVIMEIIDNWKRSGIDNAADAEDDWYDGETRYEQFQDTTQAYEDAFTDRLGELIDRTWPDTGDWTYGMREGSKEPNAPRHLIDGIPDDSIISRARYKMEGVPENLINDQIKYWKTVPYSYHDWSPTYLPEVKEAMEAHKKAENAKLVEEWKRRNEAQEILDHVSEEYRKDLEARDADLKEISNWADRALKQRSQIMDDGFENFVKHMTEVWPDAFITNNKEEAARRVAEVSGASYEESLAYVESTKGFADPSGIIYIDKDLDPFEGANTVFHEMSHIWSRLYATTNPGKWADGMKMILKSKYGLKESKRLLGPYEHYFENYPEAKELFTMLRTEEQKRSEAALEGKEYTPLNLDKYIDAFVDEAMVEAAAIKRDGAEPGTQRSLWKILDEVFAGAAGNFAETQHSNQWFGQESYLQNIADWFEGFVNYMKDFLGIPNNPKTAEEFLAQPIIDILRGQKGDSVLADYYNKRGTPEYVNKVAKELEDEAQAIKNAELEQRVKYTNNFIDPAREEYFEDYETEIEDEIKDSLSYDGYEIDDDGEATLDGETIPIEDYQDAYNKVKDQMYEEFGEGVIGAADEYYNHMLEQAFETYGKGLYELTDEESTDLQDDNDFIDIAGSGLNQGEINAALDIYDAMVNELRKAMDDSDLSEFNPSFKEKGGKEIPQSELSDRLNEMIENKAGIGKHKTYQAAAAHKQGAKKGKWRFFLPPSAEDFEGLMYKLMGRGKKGELDRKFLEDYLYKPYAKAQYLQNENRTRILKRVGSLRKAYARAGFDKEFLSSEAPGTKYTYQDAVRAYLMSDRGTKELDGMPKTTLKKLMKVMETSPELRAFAETIGKRVGNKESATGYINSDTWFPGSIDTDVMGYVENDLRTFGLDQFKKNANEIFSPENMNKLEAAFGTSYRRELQQMLNRMKTGQQRVKSDSVATERFTNWINNAVGATMFINVRSAGLQMLSALNFIGAPGNNFFKAAGAFANQPQYWADVKELMNSPYLLDRRGGAKFDVAADELADASRAKSRTSRAMQWMFKKGFYPTRMADSFAIASGGATWYRNRLNELAEQGIPENDAKKQVMLEFQEIAEKSQQSSRIDRVSNIQASPLGRLVFAFANTPLQYARITKKAALDLANNRGRPIDNLGKIAWYGGMQSIVFAALQNGLFAALLGDDDEEDELFTAKDKEAQQKKNVAYAANSMVDSWLRGWGLPGAAAASLRNIALEIKNQINSGRFNPEKAAAAGFSISPPISAKFRDLVNALRPWGWRQEIEKIENLPVTDPRNPAALSFARGTAAITNVPLDNALKLVESARVWSDDNYTQSQKVLKSLGYTDNQIGKVFSVDEKLELKLDMADGKLKNLEKKASEYEKELEEKIAKQEAKVARKIRKLEGKSTFMDYVHEYNPFNRNSPMKALSKGELGQAHNDGTIEVDPNLSPQMKKKVVAHEKQHVKDMKENGLDYDDNYVYFKGKKYTRKDGKIRYNGKWEEEGAKHLPWEKRAYAAEKKVNNEKPIKRLDDLYN